MSPAGAVPWRPAKLALAPWVDGSCSRGRSLVSEGRISVFLLLAWRCGGGLRLKGGLSPPVVGRPARGSSRGRELLSSYCLWLVSTLICLAPPVVDVVLCKSSRASLGEGLAALGSVFCAPWPTQVYGWRCGTWRFSLRCPAPTVCASGRMSCPPWLAWARLKASVLVACLPS